MKSQISNAGRNRLALRPLTAIFPALNEMWGEGVCKFCASSEISDVPTVPASPAEWTVLGAPTKYDMLSMSESGTSYDGYGCFPIGVDITGDDFFEVVQSQRNLRRLELLDPVSPGMLREFGAILYKFAARCEPSGKLNVTPFSQMLVLELSKNLTNIFDDGTGPVCVYRGLDAGFQRTLRKRFWAVYYIHASGSTDIYVSKKADDLIGTLLHTFLSSRGCARRECFEIELIFARWSVRLPKNQQITRRMLQDIEMLSPMESLCLLQQTTFHDTDSGTMQLKDIQTVVEEQLLNGPSLIQLKNINAIDYLEGSASADDLVTSRLRWYCKQNLHHPAIAAALALVLEVQVEILDILRHRRTSDLEKITGVFKRVLLHSCIDTVTDTLVLAIFCVMRKLAFEEIYLEVTDRNPLLNNQSDQAAAFAELFALGSRCEAYFDMSPSQFGKLLLDRYHAQYNNRLHQPPIYVESNMPLRTAYSEAQIDVDSNAKPNTMPTYQRFTFLSVFAVPALIDVLLLTTTKHGLYFSANMNNDEKEFATIAFMLSLLLSGAIGTWIACGGSYYLASMAFSAMNYFITTRLLGGFAFLLLAATLGLIVVSCINNTYAGLVFFLYFIVLTAYLSLLAALAHYNSNGSAFQSVSPTILALIFNR